MAGRSRMPGRKLWQYIPRLGRGRIDGAGGCNTIDGEDGGQRQTGALPAAAEDAAEGSVVGDCGSGVRGTLGFETGGDGLVPGASVVVAEEIELLFVVDKGERHADFDAALLFWRRISKCCFCGRWM